MVIVSSPSLLARAESRAQLGLWSWSYSNIKEVSHYVFLLIGVRRSQNGVHVISHRINIDDVYSAGYYMELFLRVIIINWSMSAWQI